MLDLYNNDILRNPTKKRFFSKSFHGIPQIFCKSPGATGATLEGFLFGVFAAAIYCAGIDSAPCSGAVCSEVLSICKWRSSLLFVVL